MVALMRNKTFKTIFIVILLAIVLYYCTKIFLCSSNEQNDLDKREQILKYQANKFHEAVEKYLKELIKLKLSLETLDTNIIDKHYNIIQKIIRELKKVGEDENRRIIRTTLKTINNTKLSSSINFTSLIAKNNGSERKENVLRYSCKEQYMGATYGYPEYLTGFVRKKCQRPSLNDSVSIILDRPLVYDKLTLILKETLGIASRNFKEVHVLLMEHLCEKLLKEIQISHNVYIRCVNYKDGNSLGKEINSITKESKSHFIVIASRIASLEYPLDIERMLHVHEISRASIIGTAVKDFNNGEWSHGCYQTSLQLYTLKYNPGYHVSQYECLQCNFLTGPFLGTSEFFHEFKFNENLNDGLYEDFFLRIKKYNKIILNCPDVIASTYENKIEIKNYKRFARLWDLSLIKHHTQMCYKFGCPKTHKELILKCRVKRGIAIPPCCLDYLRDGITFIFELCSKYKMVCKLQEGSVLGAVKFNNILPWEQDADMSIRSEDFDILKNLKNEFSKKSFVLIIDKKPRFCDKNNSLIGGVAHIRVHHWSVQIFGHNKHNRAYDKTTQILLGSSRVKVPENPGLYSRNRYGHEVYKHAEHWIVKKNKNSWIDYNSGLFEKCSKLKHHACLDNFHADGNIQFFDFFKHQTYEDK